MQNNLDSLLRPKSIAVLGASERQDSVGEWAIINLIKGGYKGNIFPVNPSYKAIQGRACFQSIRDLPEVPDLAIFAIGDHRIESVFDEVVAAKIPAAVIFSSLIIDDDSKPVLRDRIKSKISNSNMLVCGANGMGFYNIRDSVWACGFDSNNHYPPGNVSLISHSGSGMSGILDCEDRIRFNFAVSTGNELSVTMDQYLDFVLDLPETKVIGLFIETARNPEGFIAALKKARDKKIPIVALKVGKTEESAKLAVSHSGAIAGDDDTYDALFDRYGVQRVRDTQELVATLILFAEFGVVGDGHLVTLHDSGGERQLLIDLADEADVPLTNLNENTVKELEKILDPELLAVNPLDVWSRGGPNANKQYLECARLLLEDPNAAIEALVLNRAPKGEIYSDYVDLMIKTKTKTDKPIVLVSSHQGTGSDDIVINETHNGYPILDGVTTALVGVKKLFSYRDFFKRDNSSTIDINKEKIKHWQSIMQGKVVLSETESLNMISDFGMPTVEHGSASEKKDVIKIAAQIGYPVVLKTAMENIYHKSDQDGVILDIQNEKELVTSYESISRKIGKDVLVAKMQDKGQEMILGARRDPQFGPVIVIGIGGIYSELFNEMVFAIPPFNSRYAMQAMEKLKFQKIVSGYRGSKALDIESFCYCAEKFSNMIYEMGDAISEFDINPLILSASGCVAVDALAVGEKK